MRGPEFLALYSIVCLIVAVAASLWARRCDPLPAFARQPVDPSAASDPYELAWLRDGARGVVATALFELRRAGAIRVDAGAVAHTAPPTGLGPIETAVYRALNTRPKLKDLMKDRALIEYVERASVRYAGTYSAAGFVTTPAERSRAISATLAGLAIVVGLAVLKLVAALSTGHRNVAFLIVLAVVASIVVAVTSRPQRLNARGRAYRKQLKALYASWAPSVASAPSASMLPLYVGMVGTSVLVGTEYDDLNRGLQAARSASGGCGSGGGCSGGDGGGGGGGGCSGGGCGGGGCGGCGGG